VTKDEMVAVMDRHEEAENRRDAQAAVETFVEDCYYLNMPFGARFEGKQGVMLNYLGIFTALPDYESDRRLMVAGEDFLYEEGVIRGTFEGPVLHLEPTGRRAEFEFTAYIPFRDSLMLAEHVMYDGAQLADQLGVSLADVMSLRAAMGS
jgi:predicted ester cyclase